MCGIVGVMMRMGMHVTWSLTIIGEEHLLFPPRMDQTDERSATGLGIYVTRRAVGNLKRDFQWDTERKRGVRKVSFEFVEMMEGELMKRDWQPHLPESVEWLNKVVRTVWPILDPELFVAGVDL